jgi:hypothetical protein
MAAMPFDHPAQPLYPVWHFLSTQCVGDDVLVIYNSHRILVPLDARALVVDELHKPHTSIVKTKLLAKPLYKHGQGH